MGCAFPIRTYLSANNEPYTYSSRLLGGAPARLHTTELHLVIQLSLGDPRAAPGRRRTAPPLIFCAREIVFYFWEWDRSAYGVEDRSAVCDETEGPVDCVRGVR